MAYMYPGMDDNQRCLSLIPEPQLHNPSSLATCIDSKSSNETTGGGGQKEYRYTAVRRRPQSAEKGRRPRLLVPHTGAGIVRIDP